MNRLFIDTSNGFTFKASSQFVFWFENGQSVNLTYVKKIAFMSDSQTETVSVPQESCFFLINDSAFESQPQISLTDEKYFLLSDLKSSSITSAGSQYTAKDGSTKYIHLFYLCARSEDAGQFTDTFTIGDESYGVGADFYNEDEVLDSNLENLGIEIPKTIQKAIYESNIREEANDNILMNRKWKELLIEYWDIVARKGSYKSLISSLKWFEYGDLVKIMEYWKRDDTHRRTYISNDIEQIMGDMFRKQLSVMSKTTYIGLYLALEQASHLSTIDDTFPLYGNMRTFAAEDDDMLSARINEAQNYNSETEGVGLPNDTEPQILQIGMGTSIDDGGNEYKWNLQADVNYSNSASFSGANLTVIGGGFETNTMIFNENIPELIEISSKWSAKDLSLKMTLLGNFYSTYFMPIHLDLIHSTIENLVFTNVIKAFSTGSIYREDYLDFCEAASVTVEGPSTLFMKSMDCYSDSLTILGVKEYIPERPVLGFSPTPIERSFSDTEGQSSIEDIIMMAENMKCCFGAHAKLRAEMGRGLTGDDFIKTVKIDWVTDSGSTFTYTDTHVAITSNENGVYSEEINLLLTEAGEYEICLSFYAASGKIYTGRVKLSVLESADNIIDIYKIVRKDTSEWADTKLTVKDGKCGKYMCISDGDGEMTLSLSDFCTSIVSDPVDFVHTSFIHSSKIDFNRCVGLNHVIMVPVAPGVMLKKGDLEYNIYEEGTDRLFREVSEYWWMVVDKHTAATIEGSLSISPEKVLIGLRKEFTISSDRKVLAKKKYYYNDIEYSVDITQISCNIVSHVRSGSRQEVTFHPLSDTAEVNLLGAHTATIAVRPDYNYRSPKAKNDTEKVEVVCPIGVRYVSEDRFVPLFHDLEPLTANNNTISIDEAAVAVPRFSRVKAVSDSVITLHRCANGEEHSTITGRNAVEDTDHNPTVIDKLQTSPIAYAQTIAGAYRRAILEEGFYDISLDYSLDGDTRDTRRIYKRGAIRIL